MADGSSSFFKNKWSQYHILTAIDNLLAALLHLPDTINISHKFSATLLSFHSINHFQTSAFLPINWLVLKSITFFLNINLGSFHDHLINIKRQQINALGEKPAHPYCA